MLATAAADRHRARPAASRPRNPRARPKPRESLSSPAGDIDRSSAALPVIRTDRPCPCTRHSPPPGNGLGQSPPDEDAHIARTVDLVAALVERSAPRTSQTGLVDHAHNRPPTTHQGHADAPSVVTPLEVGGAIDRVDHPAKPVAQLPALLFIEVLGARADPRQRCLEQLRQREVGLSHPSPVGLSCGVPRPEVQRQLPGLLDGDLQRVEGR